jgi:Sel1 repeat-containing protein
MRPREIRACDMIPPIMNPRRPESVTRLRIFLSSPGDVTEERQLAREAVAELAREPGFESAKLEVISWDDPQGRTPLVAQLDPQGAVERSLPKPSECDVVVGIFWARMGSPLPPGKYKKADGGDYLSGTEYEIENAFSIDGGPDVLLYRRSEEPRWSARDPDLAGKQTQLARVDAYLECLSAVPRFISPYARPTDLKDLLKNDMRRVLSPRLAANSGESVRGTASGDSNGTTEAERWARAEQSWRKDAETGNVHAMINVALLIKERNPEEAVEWFKKAATAGSIDAMFNLGMFLKQSDREEAEKWLRKSAEAGDRSGMAQLGEMLQTRAPEEAAEWLRKAATGGVEYAMTNLGLLQKDRNPEESALWLRSAANANEPRGMYNYGLLLEARDPKQAESWFRKAAAAGNTDARLKVLDLS